MKKLVAITIIAGLVMGLASVAMAAGTATNWALMLRGSDATYGAFSGLIQIGTDSTKGDAKDSSDTKYTANTGSQAQVVAYEPTFGDTPAYYNVDKMAPIGTTAKSWTLLFWAGTGYTKDVARLSIWSTSTLSAPAISGWEYTITVDRDPTGTYTPGTKWVYTPGATGASTAPAMFKDFNNIQNTLKIADASAVDSGVKLTFTAGPAGGPIVTPEPSSMLALASGLFGMAGFAVRRRK